VRFVAQALSVLRYVFTNRKNTVSAVEGSARRVLGDFGSYSFRISRVRSENIFCRHRKEGLYVSAQPEVWLEPVNREIQRPDGITGSRAGKSVGEIEIQVFLIHRRYLRGLQYGLEGLVAQLPV